MWLILEVLRYAQCFQKRRDILLIALADNASPCRVVSRIPLSCVPKRKLSHDMLRNVSNNECYWVEHGVPNNTMNMLCYRICLMKHIQFRKRICECILTSIFGYLDNHILSYITFHSLYSFLDAFHFMSSEQLYAIVETSVKCDAMHYSPL